MGHSTSENDEQDRLINQLHQFANCHQEYNRNRIRTSCEKELLLRINRFIDQHTNFDLERTEKINPRTFCAHGTNAWALFCACAFSKGQFLSRNELKLLGIVPISGFSKGTSIENRNFLSTIPLLSLNRGLELPTRYSIASTNDFLQKKPYEYLKSKFLKKYAKRNAHQSLRDNFQSIFVHPYMQEACDRLFTMPLVTVGDGIGDSGFTFGRYSYLRTAARSEPGEILYKRFNIRVVIVNEANKAFVQKLIKKINPELEKTIAFLTTEEVKKFEDDRRSRHESLRSLYIIDFLNAFNANSILKVEYSAMRPVRIDEDVIDKGYLPFFLKTKEPILPREMHFEAGEAIYYEPCLEKTLAQAIDEVCDEALNACIEVIRVVRTVDKNVHDFFLDSIDDYFSERCRIWNYELDLYQNLHGPSAQKNFLEKIENIKSGFIITFTELDIAKYSRCLCKQIKKNHPEYFWRDSLLSAQVFIKKILKILKKDIGKINWINGGNFVCYERSVTEDKPLKILEEWTFIRESIGRFKKYSDKCNKLDSSDQQSYKSMCLSLAQSLEDFINEYPCHKGSESWGVGGQDLEELLKNLHDETIKYYNFILELLQDLSKRDDSSIEDYLIRVNSIYQEFEEFHNNMLSNYSLIFDTFSENFFPLNLLNNLSASKELLTHIELKIRNIKEAFNYRNLPKEKKLISEINDHRNRLLLSAGDSNIARNKAQSLFNIIKLCGNIEQHNLPLDRIALIRNAIQIENKTLSKHRHPRTLTPFIKILYFFKPRILEKRVYSIKLTTNLDNYLSSLDKTLQSNIKP